MVLTPRLDLRQGQTLVMTPQLQQAIKLLQLSNLELTEYVETELAQNPLLERDEGQQDGAEAPPAEGENTADAAHPDSLESMQNADSAAELPADSGLDADYENVWNNDTAADSVGPDLGTPAFADVRGHRGFDDLSPDLEETLSESLSLRDHLTRQIGIDLTEPVDRLIGLHLVDMLDEAGYLQGDLGSVAQLLGCDVARVEATLAVVQQLDPPGVFARSLKECLALQLRERDRLDPAMAALLDNLDMLAKRDLQGLIKACGVDAEDIADMVAEIRSLDPKPALAFDHAVSQPVVPDVLMRPQPGGGWIVELNADSLPRVLVNNHYFARVSKAAKSKEDKQYIAEQFQSASWLVRSLHQRATTILKVATEIVRQQDAFFAKGVSFLRPLVLRDIADAIEMHESTVSRVTSNKFIASPRGIYELKYFFTASIPSSGGGAGHSAEAVRHRIKTLIDAESPGAVLSDDTIVEILGKEGIEIARRTVAKYRDSMGIASSVQRRREKSSVL